MLHTILHILFMIGIVIAILVGLLVLICAVVLLIPVRYMAKVENSEEKQLEGQVRISWLLRVVSVKLDYNEGEYKYNIRIFGISFKKIYEWINKRTQKKEIRQNKKELKQKTKQYKAEQKIKLKNQKIQEKHQNRKDKLNEKQKKKDRRHLEYEKVPDKYKKYADNGTNKFDKYQNTIEDNQEDDYNNTDIFAELSENDNYDYVNCQSNDEYEEESKSGFFSKLFNVLKVIKKIIITTFKLPGYIVNFVRKAIEFIKKLFTTVSSAIEKIVKVKDFLTDKKNKAGIDLVRNTFGKTVKHIKPKKSNFYVRFGTGDPASTGQLLGIIAATNGLHHDFVRVVPDFDNKVLETHMYIKGRIRLINLVVIYLKLYFDDTFKRLLKRINKLKEEIM